MRHRKTDPACKKHKAPRTRLALWRFNRARGYSCLACMPTYSEFIVALVEAHLKSGGSGPANS